MSRTLLNKPEQKACPHLGEAFQPYSPSNIDNPYPFYETARAEEPIFYSPVLNAYVLTRYDDIVAVLKDPVRFSSAQRLKPLVEFTPEVFGILAQGYPMVPQIIDSDGENHKRFRIPFNKAFSSERIFALEDSIRAIANRLVDNFVNDGHAEIISQFAYPLPVEVILTMYGVPLERIADVKQWCDDMLSLMGSVQTPERQKECAQNFVEMQHFIASLIEERRQRPCNDFISDIQDSDLDMNELVMALTGTILAGHETTTNLIGNALRILLERQPLWQALCDDPSVIPHALEEVLRYESSVQNLIRTTTEEVSMTGVTLPKGTALYLILNSANRDETKYADGEHFDLERFQSENQPKHLAFGHGVHYCVGATLARLEGRIAMEVLSQRLPSLKLGSSQQFDYIPTLAVRGLKHLELEWDIP